MRSRTTTALALALPMAGGCMRNAVDSDARARREIDRIAAQAVAFAREQRATPRLPVSSEWTPPGDPCAQPAHRFAVESDDWAHPPWSDIGYRLDLPSAYRFRIVRTGAGPSERLLVLATGDPSCSGRPHQLAVTVDANLHVQPVTLP